MADFPAGRNCKTFVRLPVPETLRLSGHFPWVHGATASASFRTRIGQLGLPESRHRIPVA